MEPTIREDATTRPRRPFWKRCARTLDRPILVAGLEPEDLVGVALVSGTVLLFSPFLGVVAGAGLYAAVRTLKKGRPPGFLYHALVQAGLETFLPAFVRAPHVLRILGPGVRRGERRLLGFGGRPDRRYWPSPFDLSTVDETCHE